MARHSLGPDEPRPATSRVLRIGAFVVPRLATAWIWFARALVVTLALVIVLCRITGTTIDDLPQDDTSGSFLPQFAMTICIVFGILSPYILLPHSFISLTRREGHVLHGRTVFGRRSIDLRTARAHSWAIPSKTGTVRFVTLVGLPAGVLILGTGGVNDDGLSVDALLTDTDAPRLGAQSSLGAPLRILVEVVVPSILFLAFCFAVIIAAGMAALGT